MSFLSLQKHFRTKKLARKFQKAKSAAHLNYLKEKYRHAETV